MPLIKFAAFVAAALTSTLFTARAAGDPPRFNEFEVLRPARPDASLSLVFSLPPNNIDGLHAAVHDVSEPTSAKYGKYLSKAEVETFVAPKPESVATVTDWLSGYDLVPQVASPAGDILRVDLPITVANELLGANFTEYVHKDTNSTVIRTLDYTVPNNVLEHLRFIYPTNQFIPPLMKMTPIGVTHKARADVPASCADEITPECLQALYNIPSAPATFGNITVTGFFGEIANQTDLELFAARLRPDISNPTFDVVPLLDVPTDGPGDSEATLDIQYTVGIATDVPTTLVTIAPGQQFMAFLTLFNYLLDQEDVPLVVTTSYGFDEDALRQDLVTPLCEQYEQLAARGASVIFSSGDGGVSGGQPNDACDGGPFRPTFPSTCPYVTSVGGTTGINPEVAVPFSSGGFSKFFPRPSYQDAAVQAYVEGLNGTYQGLYNETGRAFPDVSAQGANFVINLRGEFMTINGTSASAPTFASIVALLNNERLAAGQPALGFLNPLLYSNTSVFNDIVSGSNPGCATEGFPAVTGWDPVTGLGTPDYNKMLAFVLDV
ncbi:family S53 protease-like protein [Earliella scabrosa]|nr:family S53 protease-like protein [Earliella scabrosa]